MAEVRNRAVLAGCVILSLVITSISPAQPAHDQPWVEARIDSLIPLMTLEEKVGQLNLPSARWTTYPQAIDEIQLQDIRAGRIGAILNAHGAVPTRQLQQAAVEGSRLKIPLLLGLDVIHGYRTIFPIPLAEACTWDPALVEKAARIAATEASAAGINWTFAPMVDIARDPRWGRIAEGSGEDPFLGSAMAAAGVRGFQGEDLSAPTSILACAKHYVAYGAAEGGRDYNTADISERTLREIYLQPFKAAVQAGAGSLMSAFNEISGIPSSANYHTLTEILRGEWGFDGFVVSDWTSIAELIPHGIAAGSAAAGVAALKAGVDMDMASEIYHRSIPSLITDHTLSIQTVDDAVRRVLREKFRMGLFADPYRNVNPSREKSAILTRENLAVAREVAQKSIVLLKNEGNLLPLTKAVKTIAIVGPLAADTVQPLGPWDGLGRPENVVSVLEGIRERAVPGLTVLYDSGCAVAGSSKTGFAPALAIARKADVVIAVLGENSGMSGEASSRSDISLPGVQEEFLEALWSEGKPVVLVMMNGRPLAVPWAAEHIPTILESWFLGIQSGNAIADVLFGDVNPGGKLTVSFPRTVGQVPIYYDHKNTGRPYSESHYTSKYIDLANTPLFPFGYGLSYTTFTYEHLRLAKSSVAPGDTLHVSIDVKNAGSRPGDEVVQLYIHRQSASVTRPVCELKGFRRISLKPGEVKSVEFSLPSGELGFYDASMKFTLEPGPCEVLVGGSSADTFSARFSVSAR